MPEPFNVFATCLVQLRNQRGLSQKAVALAAGMDTSYLSGLESGRRALPLPRQVERLAKALELSDGEAAMLKLSLALALAYQATGPVRAMLAGDETPRRRRHD